MHETFTPESSPQPAIHRPPAPEAGAELPPLAPDELPSNELPSNEPPLDEPPVPHRPYSRQRALWSVRLPAILTALMGLLNLWTSIIPSLPYRVQIMRNLLPFQARHASHLATALAGFALLLLAQGLWRRKQVAWLLTIGTLWFSSIAHLLKGLDYEEATCALLLATWLWLARRRFHARSDAASVRQGLRVLASAAAFTLVYGTLGYFVLDDHFRVHMGWRAAAWQTVKMFTQFYDPGPQAITNTGRHFVTSIYAVAASTFSYALVMLARPVAWRQPVSSSERARAKEIVEAHGRTSLAFCALFDDKTYWFSPGGSVVAYAQVGRVAVALGDPIGPLEDAPAALNGFLEFCERNDWRPAFYEVQEELLAYHRAAGLRVLRIAHEGIVDVPQFTLAGKEGKGLRAVTNQITKAGYSARMHEPPLSDELLEELRDVSDEWLTLMNGSEKQFSLGWFEDDYVRQSHIMAIHDPDGAITAFANIVTAYQRNEAAVDLMRRRQGTRQGTMELLFVSLFEWAKTQKFDTFNLGPSPFAGVGESEGDPATERAIHFIYEHINRFYNFKGLHGFKEKFHPSWRPLYLTYSGAAGLPVVAAAIIRADSGQDSWWEYLKHLRGGA